MLRQVACTKVQRLRTESSSTTCTSSFAHSQQGQALEHECSTHLPVRACDGQHNAREACSRANVQHAWRSAVTKLLLHQRQQRQRVVYVTHASLSRVPHGCVQHVC